MGAILTLITDFLKWVDLYAQPLEIRYKNEGRFSTSVSIIFSLLLYLIMITTMLVQYESLLSHEKPITVYTTRHDLMNPIKFKILNSSSMTDFVAMNNLDLSLPGNFIFGFALYDFQTGSYIDIDPDIMSVVAQASENIRNEDGTMTRIRRVVTPVSCEERLQNSEFKFDNITLKIMPYFSCIKEQFEVEGTFVDPVYKYFSFKIVACNPNERQCKPTEEIDEYFKHVILHFMEVKFYFASGVFASPIKHYVQIHPYSLITSILMRTDIFLTREIIQSWDSILPSFPFWNTDGTSYSFIKVGEVRKYYSAVTGGEIFNLFFRSGSHYTLTERSYLDIFKVSGMVCGLYKIFHIFFYLLIRRINYFYFNLEVCNQIFNLIDPEEIERLKKNPYLDNSENRVSCYGDISTYHPSKSNKSLINEIVLYEAFKFEKYNIINFSPFEVFLYNFGYQSPQTKLKISILNKAIENYQVFKDVKVLYNFSSNFKEFLKFAVGPKSYSQIFIITKLMNKSKFHTQNITNFKIIKNIISFVKNQNESEKDVERREILRHTLDKYRGLKKENLDMIDEKLLKMLPVDSRIMDIYINE